MAILACTMNGYLFIKKEWRETMINQPEVSEYSQAIAGYVNQMIGKDLFITLQNQATLTLLEGLDDEKSTFRYEVGKWSIKEVVGHMADAERIMSYRALRIVRGDRTPLAGFDENNYVEAANFDQYSINSLLEDFVIVRKNTLALFEKINGSSWLKQGISNDKEISVRALGYVIAGHELHHLKVLQNLYLNNLA
jgi:hypothetical protein